MDRELVLLLLLLPPRLCPAGEWLLLPVLPQDVVDVCEGSEGGGVVVVDVSVRRRFRRRRTAGSLLASASSTTGSSRAADDSDLTP